MKIDGEWRTTMITARQDSRIGLDDLADAVSRLAKARCSWGELLDIEAGRCWEHWAVPYIAEHLRIPLPDVLTKAAPPFSAKIDVLDLTSERGANDGDDEVLHDDRGVEDDPEDALDSSLLDENDELPEAHNGVVINAGYDRATLKDMIPGVHPQKAVTQARDEVGGLLVLVRQHTQYPYTNAFDQARREFWMDINEAADRANERLRTMYPIRLFFWRTTPVRDVSCYRYLGFIKFNRAAERGDRMNYVFRLSDPAARIRDLPQL
jgi:hypothetical protein